jgi:cysteine-rich repeat protein
MFDLSGRSTAVVRVLLVSTSAVALMALFVSGANAQDEQRLVVGNGSAGSRCLEAGPNGVIDSTPAGDDSIVTTETPNYVDTGITGVCETVLVPDDIPSTNGVVFGSGLPGSLLIRTGNGGTGDDGVCDSPPILGGDDIQRIPVGQGEPRWIGLLPGGNLVIDSIPGGDDASTAVVCPGLNNLIDSTPAGDDVISVIDLRCQDLCGASFGCILPGVDDVLQTTASGDDATADYLSTGADGILATTKLGDDQGDADTSLVDVPFGGGLRKSTCVTTGPDGIAQSTLCQNGVLDDDEDGNPSNNGSQCDTGGESATCDDDCTPVECGDFNTNTSAGEFCDTGGVETADCDTDCTAVTCGDSTTNTAAGEDCDPPFASGGAINCRLDCTFTVCGDGTVDADEECDDGAGNSDVLPDACRSNCVDAFCGDGVTDPGNSEECDDGNNNNNDGCLNGCILPPVCGDGVVEGDEVCDDGPGNSDTLPDACRTNCVLAFCGDGVADPGNGEECDDGNNKNNDDCIVGCVSAVCGDGKKQTTGTPPLEECDDGNVLDGDGCDSSCLTEVTEECGDGIINAICTGGTVGVSCAVNADCDTGPSDGVCGLEECDDGNASNKDDCLKNCQNAACGDGFLQNKGTPPFEECDDGNLLAGDGCSAVCEEECGNGILDGACMQGLVGSACATNTDCDSGPPDGICGLEECDTAIDGLCALPTPCSAVCSLQVCGNGQLECDEDCDLGLSNGVPGSGCAADCTRNLIGKSELKGKRECPGAWTLDNPPLDPKKRHQRCPEGVDACDADTVADGICTFRVGYCLNRPEPATCASGQVLSVDIVKLKIADPVQASAAETLTTALSGLTSGSFEVPDRCREGQRKKNCSIPDNLECDKFLGSFDGACDIGTGVIFTPPLFPIADGGEQILQCTPSATIEVPKGERLRLKAHVRRAPEGLRGDKDVMRLTCD